MERGERLLEKKDKVTIMNQLPIVDNYHDSIEEPVSDRLEFLKLFANDYINDNQLRQIMSSNIRVAHIARSNARVQNNNPYVLQRPRTVYIGKEQYPISLVPLEDILTQA